MKNKLKENISPLILNVIAVILFIFTLITFADCNRIKAKQLKESQSALIIDTYNSQFNAEKLRVDLAYQSRDTAVILNAKKGLAKLNSKDKKVMQLELDKLKGWLTQLKITMDAVSRAENSKDVKDISVAEKLVKNLKGNYLTTDKNNLQKRLDAIKAANDKAAAEAKAEAEAKAAAEAKVALSIDGTWYGNINHSGYFKLIIQSGKAVSLTVTPLPEMSDMAFTVNGDSKQINLNFKNVNFVSSGSTESLYYDGTMYISADQQISMAKIGTPSGDSLKNSFEGFSVAETGVPN